MMGIETSDMLCNHKREGIKDCILHLCDRNLPFPDRLKNKKPPTRFHLTLWLRCLCCFFEARMLNWMLIWWYDHWCQSQSATVNLFTASVTGTICDLSFNLVLIGFTWGKGYISISAAVFWQEARVHSCDVNYTKTLVVCFCTNIATLYS